MAIIIRLNDHSQTRDMYPNVKGFVVMGIYVLVAIVSIVKTTTD